MASWNHLPQDCQRLILKELANEHSRQDRALSGSLAHYASVSRGWQVFFERIIFHHLIVHPTEISDFDRIVHSGRRRFVKHILLYIPARGPLAYRGSSQSRSLTNTEQNDVDFTQAVWQLLLILSKWDRPGPNVKHELTLELGAHLSSESGVAAFKNSTQLYSRHLASWHTNDNEPLMDLAMMELKACGLEPPSESSLIDLMTTAFLAPIGLCPLNLNFSDCPSQSDATLPRAEVVTRILIRRRYLLNFDPEALNQIFRSLPRLETIHFERWRFANQRRDEKWDQRAAMLCHELPPSLSRLTVYEEENSAFRDPSCFFKSQPNRPVDSVVKASKHLKQLAVSYFIDAEDFFQSLSTETQACSSVIPAELTWPLLSSLALTSSALTSRSESSVTQILLAAASAVKMMPKLTTLELWNQEEEHVGIFRYERTDHACQLTWQGTWDLPIVGEVQDAWEIVASTITDDEKERKLLFNKKLITQISKQGVVFDNLMLKDLILHGISRVQIREQ